MKSKQRPVLHKNFIFFLRAGYSSVSQGEGMCDQMCILKESLWLQHEGHLGRARWAWRPRRDLTATMWDMGAMWTSDGEGERLDGVERYGRSNVGRAQ